MELRELLEIGPGLTALIGRRRQDHADVSSGVGAAAAGDGAGVYHHQDMASGAPEGLHGGGDAAGGAAPPGHRLRRDSYGARES